MEVSVFGNQNQFVLPGIFPDKGIRCFDQPNLPYTKAPGKYLLTDLVNAVKDSGQKAVSSGTRANWRSRLAANPRQA